MLYIENTSRDPYFNQAFEEYVFDHSETEDVLLLWRNDPAVVCGKFQNIFAEVDVLAARAKNIALIRRISGGGTVYHDSGNINYSLIHHTDSEQVEYEPFLKLIMDALGQMGVNSEVIASNGIAIGGKKISGSAQRIVRRKVLHHGTLLYDCDLNMLRSLANGGRDNFTSKGTQSVPWPVTNIKQEMADKTMSTQTFQAELLVKLKTIMPMTDHQLAPEEVREVEEMARTQYRSWAWTFGKNPAFSLARTFRLGDVDYELAYSSAKGEIIDFMMRPDVPALRTALTGKCLCPSQIEQALADYPGFEKLIRAIF